jgi:hypothetical protein
MCRLLDPKESGGEPDQAQLEALALAHTLVPGLEVLSALA